MKNEISKGIFWSIKIFAYLEIALGLLGIWLFMLSMQVQEHPNDLGRYARVACTGIMIPYFILLGVLTLKLKPIGRALNLWLSPLTSLLIWCSFGISCYYLHLSVRYSQKPLTIFSLYHPIYPLILGSGLIIFYFTRSKVKEQFKKL